MALVDGVFVHSHFQRSSPIHSRVDVFNRSISTHARVDDDYSFVSELSYRRAAHLQKKIANAKPPLRIGERAQKRVINHEPSEEWVRAQHAQHAHLETAKSRWKEAEQKVLVAARPAAHDDGESTYSWASELGDDEGGDELLDVEVNSAASVDKHQAYKHRNSNTHVKDAAAIRTLKHRKENAVVRELQHRPSGLAGARRPSHREDNASEASSVVDALPSAGVAQQTATREMPVGVRREEATTTLDAWMAYHHYLQYTVLAMEVRSVVA